MQTTRPTVTVAGKLLVCLVTAIASTIAGAQGVATQPTATTITGAQGVAIQPTAKLEPATGSWSDIVTLSGDILAKAEGVRAVWYPNDDVTQRPAMSQTVTLRGRIRPDTWQIQIPADPTKSGWPGDFSRGVLRLYVTVPGSKTPVFAASFLIGSPSAATSQSTQALLGGKLPTPPGNLPIGTTRVSGVGPVTSPITVAAASKDTPESVMSVANEGVASAADMMTAAKYATAFFNRLANDRSYAAQLLAAIQKSDSNNIVSLIQQTMPGAAISLKAINPDIKLDFQVVINKKSVWGFCISTDRSCDGHNITLG